MAVTPARWTLEDLASVRAAFDDLVLNRRVSQVVIGGRTIVYAAAALSVALPTLEEYEARIVAYLENASARRTRSRRAVTRSGL